MCRITKENIYTDRARSKYFEMFIKKVLMDNKIQLYSQYNNRHKGRAGVRVKIVTDSEKRTIEVSMLQNNSKVFEGISVLLAPQRGSINNNKTSMIEHHQIFKDSMSNFYPLLITPERPVHTYAQTEYMQRCIQHIYQAPIWSMRQKQFSPRQERSECCFIKSGTMLSSWCKLVSCCTCVFIHERKKQ